MDPQNGSQGKGAPLPLLDSDEIPKPQLGSLKPAVEVERGERRGAAGPKDNLYELHKDRALSLQQKELPQISGRTST